MLFELLNIKKSQWLIDSSCQVTALLNHVRQQNKLRDTQIEAIETYLFLKIEGKNKPLWQLFSEGFFITKQDLTALHISQNIRNIFEQNKALWALYDFSDQFLPELAQQIITTPNEIDANTLIKSIFYSVSYTDYLMSLPMGAGKTYLMAAFIYLDLYFSQNEPNNANFSHNFLVLIPSGLKSSITPSLKTIKNFDPTWVVPEPAASQLKQQLKFDILDQTKTAKKSNLAVNPNAQKVNNCLPNPFGQVFVVNAEKVILNGKTREDRSNELDLESSNQDNELRQKIGQIPNLSILIDEVHHAAKDDVKLRQVVNWWSTNTTEKGSITTVLGFSGTPYLKSAEKIHINDELFFKSSQITNTVYYYPLTQAIEQFLKVPRVHSTNLARLEIIRQGITDFQQQYQNTQYADGTIAKVAIYCSNIDDLETQIYPFLTQQLNIDDSEILKYHRGNKDYKIAKNNELEFLSLDQATSQKRYILLVQIGKEGWDCKSLTGVILSQKGDSPQNMILQTACRCLRQVDKNSHETATIWLNEENANVLNKQLQKEQNTTIDELIQLNRQSLRDHVPRTSRMAILQLPNIEFYQLKLRHTVLLLDDDPRAAQKLKHLLENSDNYRHDALIKSGQFDDLNSWSIEETIEHYGANRAHYATWCTCLCKQSFQQISRHHLSTHDDCLRALFNTISYEKDGQRFFNKNYDIEAIEHQIRLAFHIKRTLQTEQESLTETAELLLIDNLSAVTAHEKLYPDPDSIELIAKFDKDPMALNSFETDRAVLIQQLAQQGNMEEVAKVAGQTLSTATQNKDKTLHYLPYDFKQSGFEKTILEKTLALPAFQQHNLEIYYNGERGLTQFVIDCFKKTRTGYAPVGKYTPDFLILRRDQSNDQHIDKCLIIETKGEGFANDPKFIARKQFMSSDFLSHNNDRFDYLYLQDSDSADHNELTLKKTLDHFFKD